MAKFTDDSVLDAALTEIATATSLVACSAQPANHAGIAAVTLGTYAVTGPDFTNAAGDVSGRKVTVGAQTGNNASGSGDVTHIALTDGTTLLVVATTPTQAVVSGSPFDVSAFDIEFTDPT